MKPGTEQKIESLLDNCAHRLAGFREQAIRMGALIDQITQRTPQIEMSTQGLVISIPRAPAEPSVVVELPHQLVQNTPTSSGVKIYLEQPEGYREWQFDQPDAAAAHLTVLFQNQLSANS